jgi:hypothetical protein
VGEPADLVDDALHHRVGGVADVDHRDARPEVDERVAVDVDDHPTAGGLDEDGQCDAEAAGHAGGLAGEEGVRAGPGYGGDEPTFLR